MSEPTDLEAYLLRWAKDGRDRADVASAVLAMAEACRKISELVSKGPLAGPLGQLTGKQSGVDPQKNVDVQADSIITECLKDAPVACYASEELEWTLPMKAGAPLAVAADPIDGSSNVDANTSIGTIFTVLPSLADGVDDSSFLQPGRAQRAAGFAVYGPFTSLVITVGDGTHLFVLDRGDGRFLPIQYSATIPPAANEFAINASNYRHWEDAIRIYTDDLLRGREGPRGKDFNMRWTASPVADVYRILTRGGIFLYPGDLRENYALGRLRLVYEANPLAFVVEQAGGGASCGRQPILSVVPASLHQRTPIVVGSRSEVDYVVRLLKEPHGLGERSPLFTKRGLFRT